MPQARVHRRRASAPALAEGQQLVLRSPGLTPAQVAPVEEAARAAGHPRAAASWASSPTRWPRCAQAEGYHPAVLAVTGTNGKTTVTALTGQLVERSGKTVAVAGNIGPTLLDTLAHKREAGALPQVWVLELSSFQLDGVTGFEPTAAAVLNMTPGPPGLARHDGSVCGGQGAHVRRSRR